MSPFVLNSGPPKKNLITSGPSAEFSSTETHMAGRKSEVCQPIWGDFCHTLLSLLEPILYHKKNLVLPLVYPAGPVGGLCPRRLCVSSSPMNSLKLIY